MTNLKTYEEVKYETFYKIQQEASRGGEPGVGL